MNGAFIYNTIGQTVNITGNPAVDSILTAIAPIIGSAMGMGRPGIVPSLSGGQSPYDALYARNVTIPLMQTYTAQSLIGFGSAFSGTIHDVLNNFQLNKLLNISSENMRNAIENAVSSSIGQTLLQYAVNMPVMQNIMGGDIMAAINTTARMRHLLLPAQYGGPVFPMDIAGQTFIMQNALDFNRILFSRIYGTGPDGSMSVLPDLSYTRGFRTEDIFSIAEYMVRANAQLYNFSGERIGQMRGLTVAPDWSNPESVRSAVTQSNIDKVQYGIGRMVRVLDVLKQFTGDANIDELFSNLDLITGGKWATISPQTIERSLRELSSAAKILNISSKEMFNVLTEIQDATSAAFGISAGARALGVNAGGYSGIEVGQYLTEQAAFISSVKGTPLNRVIAQQTALLSLGVNSVQGRDIQLLAYAAQQGLISPGEFTNVLDSLRYGTKADQESIVKNIFIRAFGGIAEARAITNNPELMQFIRENTRGEIARQALDAIFTAQNYEISERIYGSALSMLERNQQIASSNAGLISPLPQDQTAYHFVRGIANRLSALNMPEHAQNILSRYEDVLVATRNPLQAQQAVISLIENDPRFKNFRGDLFESGRAGVATAVTRALSDEFALNNTAITQQLSAFSNIVATDFGHTKISEFMQELNTISELYNSGQKTLAKQRQEELQNKINNFVKSAPENVRGSLQAIQQSTQEFAINQRRRLQGMFLAVDRLGAATILGGDPHMGALTVLEESNRYREALIQAEEKVRTGEIQIGDVYGFLKSRLSDFLLISPQLSFSNYNELVEAVKREAEVSTYIELSAGAAASKYGVANVLSGLRQRISTRAALAEFRTQRTNQAIFESVVDDANQSLKSTFGQLLVGVFSGDVAFSRLLGIEDLDPESARTKEVQKFLQKYKISAKDFADLQTGVTALKQAQEQILELALPLGTQNMQNLFSQMEKISKERDLVKREELKSDLESMASAVLGAQGHILSDDQRKNFIDSIRAYNEAIDQVYSGASAFRSRLEKMPAAELAEVAYRGRMLGAVESARTQQDLEFINSMSGGSLEFLYDLADLSSVLNSSDRKLNKERRKLIVQSLQTLGVDIRSWADKNEISAKLRELASLSHTQIDAFKQSPEKVQALKSLAALTLEDSDQLAYTAARAIKEKESAKKYYIDGKVVLIDRSGAERGSLDFSGARIYSM